MCWASRFRYGSYVLRVCFVGLVVSWVWSEAWLSVRFRPWCQRETTLPHTSPIRPGTPCHPYHPQRQVSGQPKDPLALYEHIFIIVIFVTFVCVCVCVYLQCSGTLISHEKLLLQINTEREIGNMDYKLGQVSKRIALQSLILLTYLIHARFI